MKKIINYEKDILFKTNIGELSSISLEHDFTVDGCILKGDFLVSGEYKPNELSVNKESFEYRLPLEYELDNTADIDSLSYDIDDFEYTVKDDCLTVYIDFGVRFEEKKPEPLIPDVGITEEELNADTIELPKLADDREELEELPIEPEITDDRLGDTEQEAIVESFIEQDEYITYHVHIVRDGDTLESIAAKYNCSVELIKEYNEFETLELKSKLLIPDVQDE